MSAKDLFLERSLPSSVDAERSVLGSVLLDNRLCNQAMELLRPEDFYLEAHRRIYEKMVSLSEQGRPIDPITLGEELRRVGEYEQVGGGTYLAGLIDSIPRLENIEQYTKIVKGKSTLRKLIAASNQIIASCFEQEHDPDTIIDAAEKSIFAIAEDRLREGFVDVATIAHKRLDEVQNMAGRAEMITGVPTGFTDLDKMTAGLQRSDLVIVAARPSMGKTSLCLNIGQYAARSGYSVGVFSLEMSAQQLVSRLLCSEAHIDAHRFRTGYLNREEWARLAEGLHRLSEAKIFIDDSPGLTVLEMRAKSRRLKQEHGLDLLLVDYLQLIQGRGRPDSRTNEVSQISRDLKMLAKELDVPLIALSQLSRAPETRTDHRPQLSDLRESGCLAGDTLVTMADTGARVPIRDLAGKSGFRVWALDERTMQRVPANVSRAFATGTKAVFRLETKLGRVIRATANHKFRTFDGWRRLDELRVGERLAMPRRLPCADAGTISYAEAALLGHLIGDGCTLPRHAIQYTTRELELAEMVVDYARAVFGELVEPRVKRERTWYQVYLPAAFRLTHGKRSPVAEWLDGLGVWGLRSHEKRVPDRMFEQSEEIVARFLRHLWATDGCVQPPYAEKNSYPTVYYASSSERLSRDVQALLLKLGINAVVRPVSQGAKGRTQYPVRVMGREDVLTFADKVGAAGSRRRAALDACVEWFEGRAAKTNRDVVPSKVWEHFALPALKRRGRTLADLETSFGYPTRAALMRQNVSRSRLARLASALGDDYCLSALATSDVYWDPIISIEPDGVEEVFDLTVDDYHNFEANVYYVHNSIEQDADVVAFIYREEMYGQTDENSGVAELIIGKQRNGPTGTVRLAFLKEFTRFENLWNDNY
jgi:replicative DNA helicase